MRALCPPSPSSKPVDRCSLGWLIFVEMEEPTWRWRRLRMHFPKVTLAARYHSRHCMFHGLWRYCQADGSVVCWGNPDFGGDASATAHMLKHSVVEAWLFLTGSLMYTLPKFNTAPDKSPSQLESSLPTTMFRGYVKLWGCIIMNNNKSM